MPHVGSADPAAIPALVKLSGIDQSVLSQRTLHLTVSDPSQNRPAQPAVVRPSAEASFSSANPVPINIEIHAPAEQRASNVQPMPDLGMAGSPPTPALVTLSWIDPSVLSLQTLHLAVFDPSQTSPAPPSTSGRPSAKNAMLSGWDELEFDFLSASN